MEKAIIGSYRVETAISKVSLRAVLQNHKILLTLSYAKSKALLGLSFMGPQGLGVRFHYTLVTPLQPRDQEAGLDNELGSLYCGVDA